MSVDLIDPLVGARSDEESRQADEQRNAKLMRAIAWLDTLRKTAIPDVGLVASAGKYCTILYKGRPQFTYCPLCRMTVSEISCYSDGNLEQFRRGQ